MGETPTTRHGLSKQAYRDKLWHTLLNLTLDKIDTRLPWNNAGDPNGVVAGDYLGQFIFDSTNAKEYVCTTTGIAADAVWTDFATFVANTYTGDITGAGGGSVALTIAAGAVTLAKMANMATASLIGRKTAGAGAPEILSVADLKTLLSLVGSNSGDQTITLTGDVTGSGTGSFVATIASLALSKLANAGSAGVVGATGAGALGLLSVANLKTMLGFAGAGSSITIGSILIQWGTKTGTGAVTFGTSFSSAPKVLVGALSSNWVPYAASITTAGFTHDGQRVTDAVGSGNCTWIAIGAA